MEIEVVPVELIVNAAPVPDPIGVVPPTMPVIVVPAEPEFNVKFAAPLTVLLMVIGPLFVLNVILDPERIIGFESARVLPLPVRDKFDEIVNVPVPLKVKFPEVLIVPLIVLEPLLFIVTSPKGPVDPSVPFKVNVEQLIVNGNPIPATSFKMIGPDDRVIPPVMVNVFENVIALVPEL